MELLKQVSEHYRRDLPFVVYRKPAELKVSAFLQQDRELQTVKDFGESGFIMAPFIAGAYPTFLIRPDQFVEEPFEVGEFRLPFNSSAEVDRVQEKKIYLDKIALALEEIDRKNLQKVVLSRRISFPFKPDPIAVFTLLLRQFPRAFGYLLYHPKIGIWMGASPETLLHCNKEKFSTVSLAGTQKAEQDISPDWSAKEIREQEYVTQYIVQALKHKIHGLCVTGPKTVRAGNLYHLQTRIEASQPQASAGQLIQALHPTPAVCGIPTDKARDFLLANEGYSRRYYSGYLGELNWGADSGSHLFVNLRCMNFENDQVHVYVGGGLVKGSDPEQEWMETVYKSESMKHLIVNSQLKLG